MEIAVVFLLCLVPHFIEAGETSVWSGPKWTEEKCGVSKYPDASDGPCLQVISGCIAREHEFPWTVYIEYYRGSEVFACGGTIISECYVLTAAHCLGVYDNVTESFDLIPAENYILFIGEHERNDSVVLDIRVATEVIAHPDYDPETWACDIGLIRFDTPLEFNENISPICKPDPNATYTGEVAVVVGWGIFENDHEVLGPLSDELRYGTEDIKDCPEPYQDPKYICIKDLDSISQSTCLGDSGGAVMVKDFPGDAFRQVGVISFVTNNVCHVNSVQGNTRITQAVLDWIEEC